MGFATGSITFRRYYICGNHPTSLSDEWFDAIAQRAFGRGGEAAADGIETGWIVPTHLFDVDLSSPERITVGRFVFLAIRLDRTAPPGAVVRSYRKMEEQAALHAGGRTTLSRAERAIAGQAATERAQSEARRGMFRRIAAYPVLIDLQDGVVYLGNLGTTASDRFLALFADTFQTTLAPATAEEVAYRIADKAGAARSFEDSVPTHLTPPAADVGDASPADAAALDKSFLGREFLTWLWYRADSAEGLFEIGSNPCVTLAMHRMMHLECSYDLTGSDTIRTDAPASSPEAKAALRIGKQLTKVDLLIGAGRDEWSVTVDGPRWNMSKVIVPSSEEDDALDRLVERFNAIRRLACTLDDLLATFLKCRLGPAWRAESGAMRRWADQRKLGETPARRASA